MSLILHLLAADGSRGAQAQARLLVDELNAAVDVRHEAMTVYGGPPGNLQAEHRLAVPAGARLTQDLRAARVLRRALLELKPAVVVAHGSEPLRLLTWSRWRGRVVYHRIGVGGPALRRSWRRALHRSLIGRADRIVAVSSDAADDVRVFTTRSVTVIPNLRRPEDFSPRRQHSGRLRVLFLGALTPSKRPDRFLDIVEALAAAGHPVSASIVGDGPERSRLASRAFTLSVELPGPTADPARVLGDHDVLLFTSDRHGEGMPGVLIEAGLCELAAVSTPVPGARDVIEHAATGFIASTVAEFAQTVVTLDENRSALAQIGRRARLRCEAAFSPAAVTAAWASVLEAVVVLPVTSPARDVAASRRVGRG